MKMNEKNITFNMNGGQVNYSQDNSIINAAQYYGENEDKLSDIFKRIEENLQELKEEDAEKLSDAVDMIKEELTKSEPRASRLKSSVALIAPMITIANGIPMLADNLRKLLEHIRPYIR